jgi:hypothetical protein
MIKGMWHYIWLGIVAVIAIVYGVVMNRIGVEPNSFVRFMIDAAMIYCLTVIIIGSIKNKQNMHVATNVGFVKTKIINIVICGILLILVCIRAVYNIFDLGFGLLTSYVISGGLVCGTGYNIMRAAIMNKGEQNEH